MWSWNYVEIPLRPGERFMALYQKDNATHSHIGGGIYGGSYIQAVAYGAYTRNYGEDEQPHGRIRKWKHACFAIDIANKKVRFFEGGSIRIDDLNSWGPFEALLKNKPVDLNGMFLGTQQKKSDKQMFASYTSVNIFSRFLSD